MQSVFKTLSTSIIFVTLIILTMVQTSYCKAATITHSTLGITFSCPQGWICKQNPSGAVIGSNTIAGVIILSGHLNTSVESLKNDMKQGVSEEGMMLRPQGTFENRGAKSLALKCQGYGQGQPVKGKSFGRILSRQGGIYVTCLANPQVYNNDLENAAKAIADSVKLVNSQGNVQSNQPGQANQQVQTQSAGNLSQIFTGSWVTVTKNTQTSYRLFADGTFSTNYESSYGGNFSNQYGNTGSWGTANNTDGRGRWSVQGTPDKGRLTLQPAGEAPFQVPYQVHYENGKRFSREYYFDGVLYQVTR